MGQARPLIVELVWVWQTRVLMCGTSAVQMKISQSMDNLMRMMSSTRMCFVIGLSSLGFVMEGLLRSGGLI